MAIRDPLSITPEEDEEQMIMRRLRNSCDELKRGYRFKREIILFYLIKKTTNDFYIFLGGLIIECRESSRKLISLRKREKILNSQKRKFQSEENQFHSRQNLNISVLN